MEKTIPTLQIDKIIHSEVLYTAGNIIATTSQRGFVIYFESGEGTAKLQMQQGQTNDGGNIAHACILEYTKK